jgi:hypothetical protein
MFNIKNVNSTVSTDSGKNDSSIDNGSGVHKSYNGSISRQNAGGLQPTSYKGQQLMPIIGSGKNLNDSNSGAQGQPPLPIQKTTGFRSNRNSHHENALTLTSPEGSIGANKW